jgi:hypothetical protein
LVTWIVRRITFVWTAGRSATVLLGAGLPALSANPVSPPRATTVEIVATLFFILLTLEPPLEVAEPVCGAPAQAQASGG